MHEIGAGKLEIATFLCLLLNNPKMHKYGGDMSNG